MAKGKKRGRTTQTPLERLGDWWNKLQRKWLILGILVAVVIVCRWLLGYIADIKEVLDLCEGLPLCRPRVTPTPAPTMVPTVEPTPLPTAVPTVTPFTTPAAEAESLIILTEFDRHSNHLTLDIAGRLKNVLEDTIRTIEEGAGTAYPEIRIVVAPGRILNSEEEARRLGADYRAMIVVWGSYTDDSVHLNFTPILEMPVSIEEDTVDFAYDRAEELPLTLEAALLKGVQEELGKGTLSSLACLTIGQTLCLKERWDAAVPYLKQALASTATAKEDRTILAAAHLLLGGAYLHETTPRIDLAIYELGEALRVTSDRRMKALAHNLRGQAYIRKGIQYRDSRNPPQAILYFVRAASDFSWASLLLPEALEKAKALNKRGVAFYNLSRELNQRPGRRYNRAAIADYDLAISLLLFPGIDKGRVYRNRGLARLKEGDLAEAIEDLTQAINLFPNGMNKAGAFYRRGLARREQGDIDGALADLTQAVHMAPDYGRAHYQRGLIYWAMGNTAHALADFRDVLHLGVDPELRSKTQERVDRLRRK